jgi:hypothetical protein
MITLLRRIFPAFLLVAATAAAPAIAEWIDYPYPSEGFAVTSPSPPAFSEEPVSTSNGPVPARRYTIGIGEDGAVIIAIMDIPALTKDSLKHMDAAAIQARLQGGKGGLIKAVNGKLLTERDVTTGGTTGVQFEVSMSAGIMKVRIFLANERLYQLIAVRPAEMKSSPDEDRILDSFRLLPPPPAAH